MSIDGAAARRPRRRRILGRRGVAALEFGMVAPVLILVLVSMTDVTNAMATWWQITAAADAIGLIATNLAATISGTNTLTDIQAATASTAIYALQPSLATASPSSFGVVISSIVFTPTVTGCTASCTYRANVAWSVALQGVATARPCGTLTAVADGQNPSPGTLPADLFTATPVLVIDVTYTFLPLFKSNFGGLLTLSASGYQAPRTGDNTQWTRYTGATAALAKCPGYTS